MARAGDLDRALAFRRMAVANKERIRERNPQNYDNRVAIAADISAVAVLLGPAEAPNSPNLGRPDEAAPLAQQVLDITREAALRDPENRPPRVLAAAMLILQARSIQAARPAEAVELYHRALAEADAAGPDTSPRIRNSVLLFFTRLFRRWRALAEWRRRGSILNTRALFWKPGWPRIRRTSSRFSTWPASG